MTHYAFAKSVLWALPSSGVVRSDGAQAQGLSGDAGRSSLPVQHACERSTCAARIISGHQVLGLQSCVNAHKNRLLLIRPCAQIHHLTTLLLIFLSYNHQYVRVGAVVMVLLGERAARACGLTAHYVTLNARWG